MKSSKAYLHEAVGVRRGNRRWCWVPGRWGFGGTSWSLGRPSSPGPGLLPGPLLPGTTRRWPRAQNKRDHSCRPKIDRFTNIKIHGKFLPRDQSCVHTFECMPTIILHHVHLALGKLLASFQVAKNNLCLKRYAWNLNILINYYILNTCQVQSAMFSSCNCLCIHTSLWFNELNTDLSLLLLYPWMIMYWYSLLDWWTSSLTNLFTTSLWRQFHKCAAFTWFLRDH